MNFLQSQIVSPLQFKALMLKIDPDDDDDSDIEVAKKPFHNDAQSSMPPNTRNLRGNQVSYEAVALCCVASIPCCIFYFLKLMNPKYIYCKLITLRYKPCTYIFLYLYTSQSKISS